MLTNIISHWQKIEKLRRGEFPRPHFVTMHTCDICNQNCNGCAYAGKHSGAKMDKHKHFDAVRRLRDFGVKAFEFCGGGEPTLLEYLPDLISHIGWQGYGVGLMTNGTNITNDLISALVAHGTYVRISMETGLPDTYYTYKQTKDHDEMHRVVGKIEKLIKLRDASESDLQVSLKFSTGKSLRGVGHYMAAFDLANFLCVDRVSFGHLRHEPEELTWDEKWQEYGRYESVRDKFPMIEAHDTLAPVDPREVPQCWLNPLHLAMDHNGDLYMCCYYYYRKDAHRIGNIFTDPLEKIWGSPEHRAKVAAIDKNECAKVGCKFFAHHKAVEELRPRRRGYFL